MEQVSGYATEWLKRQVAREQARVATVLSSTRGMMDGVLKDSGEVRSTTSPNQTVLRYSYIAPVDTIFRHLSPFTRDLFTILWTASKGPGKRPHDAICRIDRVDTALTTIETAGYMSFSTDRLHTVVFLFGPAESYGHISLLVDASDTKMQLHPGSALRYESLQDPAADAINRTLDQSSEARARAIQRVIKDATKPRILSQGRSLSL